MLRKILVTIGLVLTGFASQADDVDPLVGTWVSPDGFAKQKFERTFDDNLVRTTMWFRSESVWKQVSSGVLYKRPGEVQWRSVARTRDMDDIVETALSCSSGLADGYTNRM